MIKDFMWSHFESTGDINAYLGFRECRVAREDVNKESVNTDKIH